MKKILLTIIPILILFQTNAQVIGSLNFDGNNNFVEITNSPLNEVGDGDFTFEAWIKGEDSEQVFHPMIFSNRDDNAFGGGVTFFFHGEGGATPKSLCVQIDATNYRLINNGSLNGSLLDNECHHVAISRSGNKLSFYADGVLLGESTPTNLGTVSLDQPLLIGKDKSTNNTFNGDISQCRIWNVARSESEINENKDVSLQGNETGLLAYWAMNNGSGQIVSDKTGLFNGILGSSNQMENEDPSWTEEGCVEVQTQTVSIHDNLKSFIKVSPNPTSGIIRIEYQGNENRHVRVIDQLGNILLSKTLNALTTDMDISHYPKGIYFLCVNYDDRIMTQKIIKE